MAFRFGRITGLNEPNVWDDSGGRITIQGSYRSSSLLDGLQRRDQLRGYIDGADGDELAVPIMIDGETRINGYYRILGVRVPTDEFTRQKGNLYDYQLDVVPVFGFSSPLMESIMTGSFTTNAVGAVIGDMLFFHAVPNTGQWNEYYKPGVAGDSRIAEDVIVGLNVGGGINDSALFTLTPSNYYLAAAKIEQGNPLSVVVGRQMLQQDLANLRLSNGIMRCDVAANGFLSCSWWIQGAPGHWSVAKTFKVRGTTVAGDLTGFNSVTVLRNSPEEVIVRLSMLQFTGARRVFLDLILRRGDTSIRGYLTTTNAEAWQIARTAAEAATANNYGAVTTGNIRATVNDGEGLRYVLASIRAAVVNDLANGTITQSATNTTFDFMIGVENQGGIASPGNSAVELAKFYLAQQSEKMLVVSR